MTTSETATTAETDIDRFRTPAEARSTILECVRSLPVESVSLMDAIGRVLAEDLIAPEDAPPFAAATMDGYALQSTDGSPWREVIDVQTAGRVIDTQVTPGTAIRITTGAPIPAGADAVVPVENVEVAEDHVVILQNSIRSGENVRPIGFDLRQGDPVLPAGTVLGAAEIGLVAGCGQVPVPVVRKPRVSILSTGDELVEPGEEVQPGQIRDSNRFSLVAALQSMGAEIAWSGKAPDEKDDLRRFLQKRIALDDVIVTSGGVSMGELDLIKALLNEPDLARVHFRRLSMKPGKPLNFATAGEDDRVLIFGLPGNPVSVLVTLELFVRPALLSMQRRLEIDRPRVPVVLDYDVVPSDREEYQRAIVSVGAGGRLVARSTGVQASSRLASWLSANALVVVPIGTERLPAGSVLNALLLAPPVAGAN